MSCRSSSAWNDAARETALRWATTQPKGAETSKRTERIVEGLVFSLAIVLLVAGPEVGLPIQVFEIVGGIALVGWGAVLVVKNKPAGLQFVAGVILLALGLVAALDPSLIWLVLLLGITLPLGIVIYLGISGRELS